MAGNLDDVDGRLLVPLNLITIFKIQRYLRG